MLRKIYAKFLQKGQSVYTRLRTVLSELRKTKSGIRTGHKIALYS